MVKWEKSEKYRKYLVEIQLENTRGYAIWGTDLQDNEEDKWLICEGKAVLFTNLVNIDVKLREFSPVFFDKENFCHWAEEEDHSNVYSSFDFKTLLQFEPELLQDEQYCLDLLNSLNMLQDYFIQIDKKVINEAFSKKYLQRLKDYIYNNFFWKKTSLTVEDTPGFREIVQLKKILILLYNDFTQQIQWIGSD